MSDDWTTPDGDETCKHGNQPGGCEVCDEISLAQAVGWHQAYEYAYLADYHKLPRWLRWLVGRYVPGMTTPRKDTT